MRKILISFFLCSLIVAILSARSKALDRQPNADYHARREALAKKAAGVIVLFAPMENSAGDATHGFRQEDNFYYLSGLTEPGTALLIASAEEAKEDVPARPYTEILFLPARNLIQEKWTGPKLGPENADAAEDHGIRPRGRDGQTARRRDEVADGCAPGHLHRCRLAWRNFGQRRADHLPEADQFLSRISRHKARAILASHGEGHWRGRPSAQSRRRLGRRALRRLQSREAEYFRTRNRRSDAVRMGKARLRASMRTRRS